MDGFFTFVVLIAIATPFLSIAGFVMALGLRRRVALLETMLAGVPPRFGAAPAAAATPPVEPIADPTPADEPAIESATPPEAEASEPEPIAARIQPVFPPRVDIEERLGTRWAVWVGGIALALGGLLLVRYSFEQGWFGPAARISAGAILALALIAAGEWLRRRELGQNIAGIASAHVPSVLTAAGTATAFGTVYAAHALYDFIGPAAAFVLLGAVGLATMAAAALHGPALAAFGLVAALASPLLVETKNPDPWPLLLYLALTVLAAYGLARLRLWRWLAIAAAVGAFLWGWVFVISGDQAPATAYVMIQLILAAIFIAIAPHIGEPDASAKFDLFAFLVLAGFAVLGIIVADLYDEGSARAFIAAIMVAIYLCGRPLCAARRLHAHRRCRRHGDARLLAGGATRRRRAAHGAAGTGRHAAAGGADALSGLRRSLRPCHCRSIALAHRQWARSAAEARDDLFRHGDTRPARHAGDRLLAGDGLRYERALRHCGGRGCGLGRRCHALAAE